MFLLSLSISFHSLVFRWEVPTPRSIRLGLFIQHVCVRIKLIADISALTPLTFLLMSLRCVLFVSPSTPNQLSPSNPPTLFLLSRKKEAFPVYCVYVCEWERSSPWVKNPVDMWKIAMPPFFFFLFFFYFFFLFLKTSRETVCALSTLSPFLYLYFLFFNLSSGFLFTHSSASKTSSLTQYTLIITNELLIQIPVCDFRARAFSRVTDGVRHFQRLTLCHSNMAPDVSTKMAPFKIFPLRSLLLATLIRINLI